MGYIYKIVCNITNEVYFGKCNGTYNRLSEHTCKSNNTSSKQIIARGNYQFIIIENDIEDPILLRDREYFYITTYECINQTIPWVESDSKLHRHRKEERDRYYTDVEKYKKKNKDRYYEKHAEIRADKNSKIVCECGIEYSKGNKLRHFKSQFHINNTK